MIYSEIWFWKLLYADKFLCFFLEITSRKARILLAMINVSDSKFHVPIEGMVFWQGLLVCRISSYRNQGKLLLATTSIC